MIVYGTRTVRDLCRRAGARKYWRDERLQLAGVPDRESGLIFWYRRSPAGVYEPTGSTRKPEGAVERVV